MGIITSIITSFIALAYEGISSFLHNRRHKALHKAIVTMENKVDSQWNNLIHLENSMVMYGVYNAITLEKLINTIHQMHNIITLLCKSVSMEGYFNMSRVSVLSIILLYSPLYTTGHLQVPLIPKTILIYNNDE